jgi:hypothetical protein
MSTLARFYVKRLPADHPSFQVDPQAHHRLDQRNNMKGPSLVHHLTRAAVAGLPVLNPRLALLDGWLGYGRERDTARFWNARE